MFISKIFLLFVSLLVIEASSMMYKMTENHKYEPDWIAVSSTVIPLTEYKVSVGENKAAQDAELYKKAYMKHFFKKVNVKNDFKASPGSLITVKSSSVIEQKP